MRLEEFANPEFMVEGPFADRLKAHAQGVGRAANKGMQSNFGKAAFTIGKNAAKTGFQAGLAALGNNKARGRLNVLKTTRAVMRDWQRYSGEQAKPATINNVLDFLGANYGEVGQQIEANKASLLQQAKKVEANPETGTAPSQGTRQDIISYITTTDNPDPKTVMMKIKDMLGSASANGDLPAAKAYLQKLMNDKTVVEKMPQLPAILKSVMADKKVSEALVEAEQAATLGRDKLNAIFTVVARKLLAAGMVDFNYNSKGKGASISGGSNSTGKSAPSPVPDKAVNNPSPKIPAKMSAIVGGVGQLAGDAIVFANVQKELKDEGLDERQMDMIKQMSSGSISQFMDQAKKKKLPAAVYKAVIASTGSATRASWLFSRPIDATKLKDELAEIPDTSISDRDRDIIAEKARQNGTFGKLIDALANTSVSFRSDVAMMLLAHVK